MQPYTATRIRLPLSLCFYNSICDSFADALLSFYVSGYNSDGKCDVSTVPTGMHSASICIGIIDVDELFA